MRIRSEGELTERQRCFPRLASALSRTKEYLNSVPDSHGPNTELTHKGLVGFLKRWGFLSSPVVHRAFSAVDRREFLPPSPFPLSPGLRDRIAYDNHVIPLPAPEEHPSSISQPSIVAMTSELADVRPGHSVAEFGTGSGYQTAILSRLAGGKKGGGRIVSIELNAELADHARGNLKRLGFNNVDVVAGDAENVLEHRGETFDRLVFTAALASEEEAHRFARFLKPLGILVAPVGYPGFSHQELWSYMRMGAGEDYELIRLGKPTHVAFITLKKPGGSPGG